MLGFTGNAASDVFTAWSRIAAHAYERRERLSSSAHSSPMMCVHSPHGQLRRANSLNTISRSPRTVRTPVELISLEKARARSNTIIKGRDERDSSMDELEASVMKLSLEHSQKMAQPGLLKISPPLHLEDELTASFPGILHGHQQYSPRTDDSPSVEDKRLSMVEEEAAELAQSDEFDTQKAIQKYLDKVHTRIKYLMIIFLT